MHKKTHNFLFMNFLKTLNKKMLWEWKLFRVVFSILIKIQRIDKEIKNSCIQST